MENEQTTTIKPVKSLLYWRKSKTNGSKCVPAIVSLDSEGMFSMKDQDGSNVFRIPAKGANIKFTGWGTMVVTTPSGIYDVVGSGAGISPKPTTEQLNEIQAAHGNDQTANSAATTLGAAGTAVSTGAPEAGAVGAAAMGIAFQEGVNSIKDWQQVLIDAGATVKRSNMKHFLYYVVAIIVILVVGLVIALAQKK